MAGSISPEIIAQYEQLVPISMEQAWRDEGALMTADGFVRLIDPALLLPVMDLILPSHPGALPVFATAWGDLIVQHQDRFLIVWYRFGFYHEYASDVSDLVFDYLEHPGARTNALNRLFYDDAAANLGVPEINECFGFKLPLAMGGTEDVDNVTRRKLKEHLVFLVQASGPPYELPKLAPLPSPELSEPVLTEREQQLAERGKQQLAMIQPGDVYGVKTFPEDQAVYVWQMQTGGQIFVGHDDTLLFGTPTFSTEPLLVTWRSGKRSSAADLEAEAARRRRR
ncbi:T6SS immunity protein Tdi1 domain-containing protein [Micromonospora sp. CPCC 206060]|uniref:T6SS immunity protein Tdi1 domain-containing protein n=1 Tax=Micromonospora sp. CPCC 206060 TaxID=3122406 RepID=UPI002FEEB5C5